MTVAIIRCILCRTPWTTATSTCWIEVLHHKCRQSVAFSWVQISRCSLLLSFCWSLNLFFVYLPHYLTFEHLHWAVSLPLLCLFLYFLLAQCLLVVSARLLDLHVKPRWRKHWLECFGGHYVSLFSVSVIQELSPHVLITSAKQEQSLIEFIEKLGKLSNFKSLF